MIGRMANLPRGGRCGPRGGVASHSFVRASIGRRDSLHRVMLFMSVAIVFLIIGCVLTGLGQPRFNPHGFYTGPVFVGVSLILIMFAIREYFSFRRQKIEMRRLQFETTGIGALAALTVSSNDRLGAITFVMETRPPHEVNIDAMDDLPSYNQATGSIFVPVIEPAHTVTAIEEPPTYDEAVHGLQLQGITPQQQTIVLTTTVPSLSHGISPTQVVPVTGYVVNLPMPRQSSVPLVQPQQITPPTLTGDTTIPTVTTPTSTDNSIPPTMSTTTTTAAATREEGTAGEVGEAAAGGEGGDNNNTDGNNNTGQNYNQTCI